MGAIETGVDVTQTKPAASFRKGIYRTVLVAALIALQSAVLLPALAQDDERPRWFGNSFDNRTVLAYGIPDSDYVVLWFSCTPGASVVKAGIQEEERLAEDGDLLPVQLAAGGVQIAFSETIRTNEESGGIELHVDLPLDEAQRRILTSDEPLEITLGERMRHYEMEGAAEPAARMIAACDSPKPASDLDVTVTNKAKRPLQSFAYSQAGVNDFNSDTFGYETLASGASRAFTIPGGRDICSFDISVFFVEADEEECCSMGEPAGTQNLCENSEFVIHD
jgi:hypothetical protein